MKQWWLLDDANLRESMKIGLINLATQAYIDAHPEVRYIDAYSYAVSLFEDEEPLTLPPFLEELRLYKLKENLLKWVDFKEADYLKAHPLRVLKAVLTQNKKAFPDSTFWATTPLDINKFPHLRSFDEAELLWKQLEENDMFSGIKGADGRLSVDLLRASFSAALKSAHQRQNIIDDLFLPSPNLNETTGIYHDGFSFRNAENQTFHSLLLRPELDKVQEFRNLTQTQQRDFLIEFFEQRGKAPNLKKGLSGIR